MVSNKKIFMVVNVDWFFLSHRLELAKSLLADGNNVYIITKNTGKKQEIVSHGLNFIDAPFERSGTNLIEELKLIYFLYNLYKSNSPDIIHHITIKPALYGSLALRFLRKKIKLINAISGLGYNFIDNRKSIIQRLVLKLMNIAFRRKDVNFIFQNPDDKEFYSSLNYLNEHNNIIIKGAGVNHTEFDYVKPILKEKLIVVFSGRMLLDKGLVEFMEATRILKDKFFNKVEFILIGDIDLNNKASASLDLIHQYLFEGYLTWLGHQENVKPILIKSDIVCLPSYREGLPKALIEAMAIGRPIITTDAPGCRECVDDKSNGCLVPVKSIDELANKLDILLSDEHLRISMGVASRNKMVKELSLQYVIQETKLFYKKIINV